MAVGHYIYRDDLVVSLYNMSEVEVLDGYLGGSGEMPDVIFNNEVGAFEEIKSKCGGRDDDEPLVLTWEKLGFKPIGVYKVDTAVYTGSRERAADLYKFHGGDGGDGGDDDEDDWDDFIVDAVAIEAVVPEELILIPAIAMGGEDYFGEDLYA